MASAGFLLEGAMAAEEEVPARCGLRTLNLPAVAVAPAGISGGGKSASKARAPKKVAAAVDPSGFGNENKEPVDYLLTVEYKPFDRQEQDCLSDEQYKKYIEAADFFDELRKMLAESQKQLREEHGYVVDN
ncbi:unnamed protein product [Alopecurus aequalis]